MRDDEKFKPPKVQKSSCLQAFKITALKLLFILHAPLYLP